MKVLSKLVVALALYVVFSIEAGANQCLEFSAQSNASCQSSYTYEKQTLYFDSSVIGEQSLKLERISENSTGDIVNIQFMFVGDCAAEGYCGLSNDAFLDLYIDGFRDAIENETLYEYVEDVCDPTMEICCDDFQCTEIYSVPGEPTMTTQARAGFVARYLADGVAGGALGALGANIVDAAIGLFTNDEFISDALQGSKFTVVSHNGEQFICKMEGSTCETIEGSFSNDGASFMTDNYQDARVLQDFLQEYYNHYHIRCGTQMTCDAANSCAVTYYCE